ncbi:MAG: glycoside hydrolase family 130 protein [SAR324 cluster bacterium]|nr:glycoside hydrolase family 130 protein [SAR324 cluster bacterium]
MKKKAISVKREMIKIVGDASRVITRLNRPDNVHRISKIIERVSSLPKPVVEKLFKHVMADFSERHRDIKQVFLRHLRAVEAFLPLDFELSETQKYLIGAYFTMEYSIESAALFNPSIVPHPDQSDLPRGSMRFVMSLRATGEGHISSIVFRSGIIDAHNQIIFDPVSEYVETPELQMDPVYNRALFQLKLSEIEALNEVTSRLMSQLPETFSYNRLKQVVENFRSQRFFSQKIQNDILEIVYWLAHSNYKINFKDDKSISERVIFPISENESRGIEDARFVRFEGDHGEVSYYATYTAYNGVNILPQLIETKDFIHFDVATLNGKSVRNKGMALFPRKINGKFVMLSRQDGENNFVMFSENIHFWHEHKLIQEPIQPWEFFQIGNCGSPLETEKGWLVLTHGVGPMREYCIGAILLDLDDPSKIIGNLREPLITPHETEREGYVPNVVYSCGSMIHQGELVIPYAMSDLMTGMATVRVNDLLKAMS